MSTANVVGYVLTVALSRLLGPVDYGALGAVIGVILIGSIPGLALQQVAARRAAQALTTRDGVFRASGLDRQSARDAMHLGLGSLAIGGLMVVPLTSFLHLGSPMTALWASISLAPVPLLGAVQGFLQGTRRFGTLAIVFISAALLRLVAAVSAASAGLGVEGVVAGIALAAILAAAVARSLVQVAPPSAKTSRPGLGGPLLEVFGVIPVIGGLLLLASTDVLLARHYLSATEAGTYAVGSIVTKVTFWAPQFVAVLSFSDLADPQRREAALRKALSLIVGVTAVATLATWVLARPLVHLVLGRAYLSLAPQAWLFALLGGLLALGQLLMTAGIASHQGGLARRLWLCIALQIVLVSAYWHHSVRQVVACSLACTLALVIISGRSAVLTAKRHTGASALD